MIGYTRDSMGLDRDTHVKIITVCQDSGHFGRGGRYRCDYYRLFQGFRFISSRSATYETERLGRGFKDRRLGKGIPCRSHTKGKSRRATNRGSQSNLRCAARNVLGALRFLVYVNDIWRNIDPSIRVLADDCIIYKKVTNKNDIDTLGEWAVENGMKINPGIIKAIKFTRARVKNPLGYSLGDQKIPEANSCKYWE